MKTEPTIVSTRVLRLVGALILVALAVCLFMIVRPFLTPLGWSAVVALGVWPLSSKFRRLSGLSDRVSSLVITAGLTMVILVVVVPLLLNLTHEAGVAVRLLQSELGEADSPLLSKLKNVPLVGDELSARAHEFRTRNAQGIFDAIRSYQDEILTFARGAVQRALRTGFRFVVFLFSLYFMLLHGEVVARQIRSVASTLGGERYLRMLDTVASTVRAAVHGLLLTAGVQALLAGGGFAVAGAPVPILLGVLTFFMALTPFGPAALYLPVAAGMVLAGSPWFVGVALALWGLAVVSTADNFLRPMLIGNSIGMPTLLVFVGALGGIASFGLLGVILGPAIIAVALGLWRELLPRDLLHS